jgi:exodeoxyribonuclease VII large subunit
VRDLFEPAEPTDVVGVSELIERLRDTLDQEFGEFWVAGEIGSLFASRPGHVYFDLKDEDGQMRCVVFRRAAQRLSFEPQDGLLVHARVHLDLYPQRGTLQLIVEELKPAGEGALRLAFERLKQSLAAEGLFASEHKQELPVWPRRVGLVTSLQGAAVHDFVRALRARGAGLEIVAVDTRVQGEGAWREVVQGMHRLDAEGAVDVIVVARGGGSLEDLWTFNREEVVRAAFALSTPLVSAIGHEVDVVLLDLVADVRAATPTAAAALVSPDAAGLREQLSGLELRLVRLQRQRLAHEAQRLTALRRGLVHPAQRLAELQRRLVAGDGALRRALGRDLAARRERVGEQGARLRAGASRGGERRDARLRAARGRLEALSPLAVLGRGYALVRRASDGAILRTTREAPVGSELDVRLAEGSLRAAVTAREDLAEDT